MVIKQRKFTIFIFIALTISVIIIADVSYLSSQEEARLAAWNTVDIPSIPSETGVFRRSADVLDYTAMPEDVENQRSLEVYYKNRAFPGAPPMIPHPLASEKGIGGNTCLQCHENGGFVPKFNAYAPITPHPEMLNCKQCHVSSKTASRFKPSAWEKHRHPDIHNTALAGSPPTIPHTLQMRENCLACHAGPAAPKEIRVSHPSRINCRQCHVPAADKIQWDSMQWDRGSVLKNLNN
ncbi:hypothetical protein QQ020_01000 [Fulvivirgaceae bacterium BMA12]|uniref:Periplasmic nitrate reductase, electron transfer subunit n=1 Tax=Agaribacillus aureus TaxID=3051825 RepID=A0ABT8KYS3_9BACT|nr:hypothetical protein [Fulvivirgaceae bacterium BMA12]